MTSPEHTVYDELAVGYALDALEPADEAAFRAHLPGCARCARTLGESAEALAALADASELVDPPPELLPQLLARLAESGQGTPVPRTDADASPGGTRPGERPPVPEQPREVVPPLGPPPPAPRPPTPPRSVPGPPGPAHRAPASSGGQAPSAPDGPAAPDSPAAAETHAVADAPPAARTPAAAARLGRGSRAAAGRAPELPRGSRRPGRQGPPATRSRRRLAAAAALVLAVVAGGSGVAGTLAARRSGQDAVTAQAPAAELRRELAATRQLTTLLLDESVTRAPLRTPAGRSVGTVLVREQDAFVVPHGLPANDRTRSTYVLWSMASPTAAPQPVGVFDVTGAEARLHPVGSAPAPSAAFAVSREAGRVAPPAPTAIVASGGVRS